jgi:hypothetical protein
MTIYAVLRHQDEDIADYRIVKIPSSVPYTVNKDGIFCGRVLQLAPFNRGGSWGYVAFAYDSQYTVYRKYDTMFELMDEILLIQTGWSKKYSLEALSKVI